MLFLLIAVVIYALYTTLNALLALFTYPLISYL